MKTVVLLSGGLDSTTALAIAKRAGYELYGLTFDYGQKHKKEIKCAKRIAKEIGVREHKIFKIDLKQIGGSALTDSNIKVPEDRNKQSIQQGIPVTYVPFRNTILLSFAVAYAEVIGADVIFVGVNYIDYSGYPDCRPEYLREFEKVIELGTKVGIEKKKKIIIEAPLLNLTKKDIILKGKELDVPLYLTWSCYNGRKKACGKCDSCRFRLAGFREAGENDPIEYEEN